LLRPALQVLGPLADLAGRIGTAERYGLAAAGLARRAAPPSFPPVQGQGFGGREDGKAAQKGQDKGDLLKDAPLFVQSKTAKIPKKKVTRISLTESISSVVAWFGQWESAKVANHYNSKSPPHGCRTLQ
jgi:hypothetical protein